MIFFEGCWTTSTQPTSANTLRLFNTYYKTIWSLITTYFDMRSKVLINWSKTLEYRVWTNCKYVDIKKKLQPTLQASQSERYYISNDVFHCNTLSCTQYWTRTWALERQDIKLTHVDTIPCCFLLVVPDPRYSWCSRVITSFAHKPLTVSYYSQYDEYPSRSRNEIQVPIWLC